MNATKQKLQINCLYPHHSKNHRLLWFNFIGLLNGELPGLDGLAQICVSPFLNNESMNCLVLLLLDTGYFLESARSLDH